MKVLQLCLKPPLPARDGGCIAMHNITTGLLEAGHQVKILTIYTQKHDLMLDAMPKWYLDQTGIEGVFVDTRVNVVDAFTNFMTADSYNVSRFFSTDFDIRLSRLLQEKKFDVIQLESLFMTCYLATIRRYTNVPVVMRSHNLEFVIWEKMASGTRNVARKAYLNYLSRKLKEYELSIVASVNGIAAISEEDKQRFIELGVKKPIRSIPVGIDISEYVIDENGEGPELCLFHLGSMDWTPNLEGILWFLEDIWPNVHKRFPELKLRLAGRNMPEDLSGMGYPNLIIDGEVEDARQYMRSKAIMIVPLLSAGGIRVKIIEGLALGKAIVSTTIGAEGIPCEHGKDIMIANTVEEWVSAIELLMNKEQMNRIGREGRQLAERCFDKKLIIKELVDFYRELRRDNPRK
jgi:glycosyltransferase involved in cell wall biosynthesis